LGLESERTLGNVNRDVSEVETGTCIALALHFQQEASYMPNPEKDNARAAFLFVFGPASV
jgi:hypothetical protein